MDLQAGNVRESATKPFALSTRRETERLRVLTETIVMVALSGALYLIKVFPLPQGGSIALGSMVPIFLLALRRGPWIGIVGGVAFGLVALVEDVSSGAEVIFYPAQVILDYPLALGFLVLAGLFQKIPVVGVGVEVASSF